MDFLAGADLAVRVLFQAFGQPKVPDSGSVTYSLRGDSGTVLTSGSLSPPAGANFVVVPILATNNSLTQRYEYRTLIVSFAVNAAKYSVTQRYRLLPFLNYACTSDDARGFLGIGKDELKDEEIDFPASYFSIEDSVGQATLENMLAGTPPQRKGANDAVLYTAVLAVIPSLKLRTSFTQTDGPLGFSRFRNTPDFDSLAREAQARLSDALDTAGSRDTVNPTLIVVSTPTDPITGV
jgi:hypothetical protein